MKRFPLKSLQSAGLAMFLSALCFSAVGQVVVWGDNEYGQTNVPENATNLLALAAGDAHCLALKTDGTVLAWGMSSFGRTNVPFGLTNAVSIAAGSSHSLALRSDNTIALWGRIFPSGVTNVPPEATNIVALALGPGAQHALALRKDGTVLDWGGLYPSLTAPPANARNLVAVAAGDYFAVALRSDGRVVAWGKDPQTGALQVPPSATNIVAIAAGWNNVAALRADGTVLTWGSVSSLPAANGFTNVVDLASPFAGYLGSVLALRRDGTVTQSGTGPFGPTNNVTAIGAGSFNGLALAGSGPPIFPGFPINRTVPGGSTAYLRLLAVGRMPMFYQWTCNDTNLSGATNSVLALTNVQPSLGGTYYTLVASNASGMATSGPIILNEVASEVAVQPQWQTAFPSYNVTFTATVTGKGPFSYQWRFGGTNLDAATTTSLSLANVQMSQTGTYSLLVSNEFGIVTNTDAFFNVVPLPTFERINQVAGLVTLTWSATTGLVFQLQYSSDLSSRNWSNLGSTITASNATVNGSDTNGTELQRFYRLLVTP